LREAYARNTRAGAGKTAGSNGSRPRRASGGERGLLLRFGIRVELPYQVDRKGVLGSLGEK